MNKWKNKLCSLKFNILLENAINFSDIIFSLQVVLLQNGFEQFNRIKVKIRSHFKNLANYEEDEKILNKFYYF